MKHTLIAFSEDALYSPNFADQDSIKPYLEVVPTVGAVVSCGDDSVLRKIACGASLLNAVLVVNMAELDPSDSQQYNTNVAMSPSGIILSKYRKRHLYYEPAFDSNTNTTAVTFRNPLDNLTYGLLTCNDLTYEDSVIQLAPVVDVIIAPAWWVNLPPIITGTSYFLGLSYSYNTTLMVAG